MKKFSYILLLSALIACLGYASYGNKRKPLQLVEDGQPMAAIILNQAASPIEHYAARELQRAIRLMTDAELPIQTSHENVNASIVIGTPSRNPLVKSESFIKENEEEIYIHRDESTLFLSGASERASLYAVYTFLDEVLGARWYWPGEEGEYLPRHRSITIDDLSIRQVPSIEYRTLALNIMDEETDTWMARNRMNVHSYPPSRMPRTVVETRKKKGFLTRVASHNVTLPNEILQKHPEYVALANGRRYITTNHPPHLCWSNPGVRDEIVKRIGGWWEERSDLDIVHFYPSDQTAFCECTDCIEMAPDVSTRWQKFSAGVLEQLDASYPGKRYWTYAYSGYRPAPTSAPANFGYIGYATYRARYRHYLSKENSANLALKEEISGWLNQGGKMGVRGYEYLTFREPMFVPLLPWVVDQIKWMKSLGMNGYISEVEPYNHVAPFIEKTKRKRLENRQWVGNRLALYGAARALWNSELTANEIRADWCEHLFGAAAEPMQQYYREMEDAWMLPKSEALGFYQHAVGGLVDRFITFDLLQKAGDSIDLAAVALADMPKSEARSRAIAQMQLEARMLEKWRTAFSFHQDQAESVRQFATFAGSAPEASNWEGAEFQPIKGSGDAMVSTAFQWTEDELFIRVRGLEQHLSNDEVQLDLEVDPISHRSYRLTASLKGSVKLEESENGFDYTSGLGEQGAIRITSDRSSGILDLSIPLSLLKCKPTTGTDWRLAARTISERPGHQNSTATYSPSVQVTLQFVSSPQHLVFFDHGDKNTALNVAIQDRGWKTTRIINDEGVLKKALEQNPTCLLIRYEDQLSLSPQFIQGELQQYMEQGGTVVLSVTEAFPFDEWFAEGEVQWVGSDVLRWGKHLPAGKPRWQMQPNDLTRIFQRGREPRTGLQTSNKEWQKLVQVQTEKDGNFPYLLRKPVGKGAVIVTTLHLAYGGGYAMFGNQYVPDVAMLIENLSSFPPRRK